jgi:hypothetical protein
MRMQAAAFGGTLRCIEQCCRGRDGCARHVGGSWGEKVMRQATWRSQAAAFRDNAVVQWALLSVERRLCNERRWEMQRCGFILFAHGHGWDPLEGRGGSQNYNRIKDRDIFYVRDIFSVPLFAHVFT